MDAEPYKIPQSKQIPSMNIEEKRSKDLHIPNKEYTRYTLVCLAE